MSVCNRLRVCKTRITTQLNVTKLLPIAIYSSARLKNPKFSVKL